MCERQDAGRDLSSYDTLQDSFGENQRDVTGFENLAISHNPVQSTGRKVVFQLFSFLFS